MKKNFLKAFFISLICFILAYIGIGYFILNNGIKSPRGKDSANNKNEILFLLLGIDAQDLTQEKGARTDTMMLVKVNLSTEGVDILSIPRDTRVNIDGRKGRSKINAAHAHGGPELAVKTVRQLLGLELDYYVKVDYKIVEEAVDAIGGVEVEVSQDMYYEDPSADPPLVIDLKEGRQVLDGQKSLQFLRFRKGYKDADLGRIRAQQQFMKAFIEQALRPKNLFKLPRMVPSYYRNVDTNIPMSTLTKMALSARKINTDNINLSTIPGNGKWIDGVSYYIYDENQLNIIVREMFGDYIYDNR
ncbi:LCP family protein [Anaerosalibacter bizertensis]|uniref:LCP family protein n=1 Tax=Anaerosalibacter bizertensis TaxID=932217 RepID=A0A9Q4AAY7_9FIRM|nr:LCP family protein [Anaerosalibacter bizertensis]MBV1817240.1 LCP family protein [Bacteroidales bacterium MSK.15.36]MCG4564357.1 LCP family protein [Anaerosalibacter bizertensis]